MLSYQEFLNENLNKSISGMDRFGMDHGYSLYVAIIGDSDSDEYDIYFFPGKISFENFIVDKYLLKDRDHIAKYITDDNFLNIDGAYIDHNEVGDGGYVHVVNGQWQEGETKGIFNHPKMYYVYEFPQNTIGDAFKLQITWGLDKEKLENHFLPEFEKRFKGPTYDEYHYGNGEIDLKRLIKGEIQHFHVIDNHGKKKKETSNLKA